MSLNTTASAERIHIGFFGLRNAGKSSLVNAVTRQSLSVVSDVAGTTTDAVKKAMELLPIGPVVIIDTPGIDDEGALGSLRVEATKKVLKKTDIAVLVTDSTKELSAPEKELIVYFKEQNISYIIARNKCDLLPEVPKAAENEIFVSATAGINITELKNLIGRFAKKSDKTILGGLINKNDIVVLVTPIDEAAPKGRLILPQQQVLREVLDKNATAIVVQTSELSGALNSLNKKPALVITDSQAFKEVSAVVDKTIPLTSFSILFARYKGMLKITVDGSRKIDSLKDGDVVLISEGCTHHRQCNDIGTVKLPNLLLKHTNKKLNFEFTSGGDFPDDLQKYKLVIHCGGCMLSEREMINRIKAAKSQNVPITNYGITIAHITGILKRSIEMLKEI